jgi:hypothetical protein
MENSKTNQFVSLKLYAILSSVVKPHAFQLHESYLCSVYPCMYSVPVSHLVAIVDIRSIVMVLQSLCEVTLILFNNGPKAQE